MFHRSSWLIALAGPPLLWLLAWLFPPLLSALMAGSVFVAAAMALIGQVELGRELLIATGVFDTIAAYFTVLVAWEFGVVRRAGASAKRSD